MRKKLKIIPLILLLAALLGGCASRYLPDDMSEEIIVDRTKQILDMVHSGDYQGFVDAFSEDLTQDESVEIALVEEQFKTLFEDVGTFERIKETLVTAAKNEATEADEAICIAQCVYSDGIVTYRLRFNKNLDLLEFFTG